jgi:hypothetical protein
MTSLSSGWMNVKRPPAVEGVVKTRMTAFSDLLEGQVVGAGLRLSPPSIVAKRI